MNFDFTTKNVLITGGSRGIGSVTAKLFAAAGANVTFTYNSNAEAAEQTLAELGAGNHNIYKLDLSDPAAIKDFFDWYAQRYDRLDILVNNAAVHLPHHVVDSDFDSWRQCWDDTLRANLMGPANM